MFPHYGRVFSLQPFSKQLNKKIIKLLLSFQKVTIPFSSGLYKIKKKFTHHWYVCHTINVRRELFRFLFFWCTEKNNLIYRISNKNNAEMKQTKISKCFSIWTAHAFVFLQIKVREEKLRARSSFRCIQIGLVNVHVEWDGIHCREERWHFDYAGAPDDSKFTRKYG